MAKSPPLEPFTHPCPRPPRAVIFDLDGTLIDSLPVIAASYNAGLKATGHRTMRPEQITAMLGPTLENLYALRVKPEEIPAACAAYRTQFSELFAAHITASPGALDLLDKLRAAGVPIAVCTNRAKHVEELLAQTGLADRIDAVVQLADAPDNPKPHPALLYVAMERIDAIPAETCYVGDSEADMRAGAVAKTWTIGLCTLGLEPHDLEAAGAHVVAKDLTVLPKVLGLVKTPAPVAVAPAAVVEEAAEETAEEAAPATAASEPAVTEPVAESPSPPAEPPAPAPPSDSAPQSAEPPAPPEPVVPEPIAESPSPPAEPPAPAPPEPVVPEPVAESPSPPAEPPAPAPPEPVVPQPVAESPPPASPPPSAEPPAPAPPSDSAPQSAPPLAPPAASEPAPAPSWPPGPETVPPPPLPTPAPPAADEAIPDPPPPPPAAPEPPAFP